MIIFFIAGWAGVALGVYLLLADWLDWTLPARLDHAMTEYGEWAALVFVLSWIVWGNYAAYALFGA